MRIFIMSVIGLFVLASVTPAHASDDQVLCETAAEKAERRHALPDKLLQAISIVETGRAGPDAQTAWPWTVNIAGRGHYFKSLKEARSFAQSKAKLGASSMDIGCFQINTKWHGKSFSTINTMFDPETGADYAASFLKDLQIEFGDWDKAVKNYHSRTTTKGERYGKKVSAVMENISADKDTPEKKSLLTAVAPLTRFQPGGVELAIFASGSPLAKDATRRPLLSTENSSWK